MKQKKTMLIMVIVLAVLLVLYGGLKAWNSHSEKQKKAKEDKEKVSLVDVKSLKSFAYESGGSKMSFTKDDGEWVYDEDDGVRLNQSTIRSTAKEITGLTAVRKLSDPDEKADYGLDSSDYPVTTRQRMEPKERLKSAMQPETIIMRCSRIRMQYIPFQVRWYRIWYSICHP